MHEWVGRVARESARWGDHCFFFCQRRLISFLIFLFLFFLRKLEVEQDGEGVSEGEEKRREEKRERRPTILMVPSQELEQKVSLATRFQWTA